MSSKLKKVANKRSTTKKFGGKKGSRSTVNGKFVLVTPKSGSWEVKREGSNRSRLFDTQADAVAAASKTARGSKSSVMIRRNDGSMRKVSTSRADSLMLDVWKSTRKDSPAPRKR